MALRILERFPIYTPHINNWKTNVMSALIPGEQRQSILLQGKPLEDGDKFKYLGSMLIANDQVTKKIEARFAFSRLQS